MKNEFFRVAAAVPSVQPADVNANTESIVALINRIKDADADMIVFPEMSLTGYTCGDLFHNSTLIDAIDNAVARICSETASEESPLVIVGAPVLLNGRMYNCALAIRERVIAAVPKTYLPNYNEFYEKRWWQPAPDISDASGTVTINGNQVPFGTGLILDFCGSRIAVEICEDLWTPIPPSSHAALAGAEIIANLSASDDIIGKYDYLRGLVDQQSARCLCGYVYSSAGYGESSTDLVFDGKAIISENGHTLCCNHRWQHGPQYVLSDIDLKAIRHDRMHIGSYADCAKRNIGDKYTIIDCGKRKTGDVWSLQRQVKPLPFVPSDDDMGSRCREIIEIQTAGLCRRLQFTHCSNLVIGISGGLDSTLALLIAVNAFDHLGIDRKGICGVTMPGFGTSGRTHANAVALMDALGVSQREISIVAAVNQHFSDISHAPSVHDVTYENSQARERTQLLMDIANQVNGMVLGTGDLSELALGWATYNGDHMSMYGVNAGVPKTLVRHLTRYFANHVVTETCRITLLDIIDTPISPELTPTDNNGNIAQLTEDLVGPYELHDFFLYYTLRFGFTPKRIYLLALQAFDGHYDAETVKKWMKTFFRRFFTQQFKRSCLPDGPKVGSICLSPRGDWRMPSDASAKIWLDECDKL